MMGEKEKKLIRGCCLYPSLVSRTMGAVKRDAVRMAEIYQIKVPRAKKYVWLMVLVPVLLLTAVFLPEYAASKSASNLDRERVKQNTERLHRLLVNSGAEASDARLLELPELPAGFEEQFLEGSYYEGLNIHDESANCSAAYLTDPEDVNNEYDSFKFYLEMGEGSN